MQCVMTLGARSSSIKPRLESQSAKGESKMSGLTASSKLLGSMIVIVTSCLVISGCNKVEDVPPRLAKGCYVIDLPGGSLVKSNIFASVGDILEPLAKAEGSTLEIKEAGDGYIVRSTFKDQLSGSEKKIAIQFDLSSQKADNSDSPIGAHCGPEVYRQLCT